ncbi:DUF6660 family protein [Fulvitalea axinellae]
MRSFVTIWALVMLSLAILPCADTLHLAGDHPSQLVEEFCGDGDSHDTSHEHPVCGPLCVCDCCGVMVPVNMDFTVTLQAPETSEVVHFFNYRDPNVVGSYSDIWHPPKS